MVTVSDSRDDGPLRLDSRLTEGRVVPRMDIALSTRTRVGAGGDDGRIGLKQNTPLAK